RIKAKEIQSVLLLLENEFSVSAVLEKPAGDSPAISPRHQSADVFSAGPGERARIHQDSSSDKSGRPRVGLRSLHNHRIDFAFCEPGKHRAASMAFDGEASRQTGLPDAGFGSEAGALGK